MFARYQQPTKYPSNLSGEDACFALVSEARTLESGSSMLAKKAEQVALHYLGSAMLNMYLYGCGMLRLDPPTYIYIYISVALPFLTYWIPFRPTKSYLQIKTMLKEGDIGSLLGPHLAHKRHTSYSRDSKQRPHRRLQKATQNMHPKRIGKGSN